MTFHEKASILAAIGRARRVYVTAMALNDAYHVNVTKTEARRVVRKLENREVKAYESGQDLVLDAGDLYT